MRLPRFIYFYLAALHRGSASAAAGAGPPLAASGQPRQAATPTTSTQASAASSSSESSSICAVCCCETRPSGVSALRSWHACGNDHDGDFVCAECSFRLWAEQPHDRSGGEEDEEALSGERPRAAAFNPCPLCRGGMRCGHDAWAEAVRGSQAAAAARKDLEEAPSGASGTGSGEAGLGGARGNEGGSSCSQPGATRSDEEVVAGESQERCNGKGRDYRSKLAFQVFAATFTRVVLSEVAVVVQRAAETRRIPPHVAARVLADVSRRLQAHLPNTLFSSDEEDPRAPVRSGRGGGGGGLFPATVGGIGSLSKDARVRLCSENWLGFLTDAVGLYIQELHYAGMDALLKDAGEDRSAIQHLAGTYLLEWYRQHGTFLDGFLDHLVALQNEEGEEGQSDPELNQRWVALETAEGKIQHPMAVAGFFAPLMEKLLAAFGMQPAQGQPVYYWELLRELGVFLYWLCVGVHPPFLCCGEATASGKCSACGHPVIGRLLRKASAKDPPRGPTTRAQQENKNSESKSSSPWASCCAGAAASRNLLEARRRANRILDKIYGAGRGRPSRLKISQHEDEQDEDDTTTCLASYRPVDAVLLFQAAVQHGPLRLVANPQVYREGERAFWKKLDSIERAREMREAKRAEWTSQARSTAVVPGRAPPPSFLSRTAGKRPGLLLATGSPVSSCSRDFSGLFEQEFFAQPLADCLCFASLKSFGQTCRAFWNGETLLEADKRIPQSYMWGAIANAYRNGAPWPTVFPPPPGTRRIWMSRRLQAADHARLEREREENSRRYMIAMTEPAVVREDDAPHTPDTSTTSSSGRRNSRHRAHSRSRSPPHSSFSAESFQRRGLGMRVSHVREARDDEERSRAAAGDEELPIVWTTLGDEFGDNCDDFAGRQNHPDEQFRRPRRGRHYRGAVAIRSLEAAARAGNGFDSDLIDDLVDGSGSAWDGPGLGDDEEQEDDDDADGGADFTFDPGSRGSRGDDPDGGAGPAAGSCSAGATGRCAGVIRLSPATQNNFVEHEHPPVRVRSLLQRRRKRRRTALAEQKSAANGNETK